MSLFQYEMDENVAVLTMTGKENLFNYQFFDEFHQVLDEIEGRSEASVLVVTASDEKIWSNGIDLKWLLAEADKNGPQAWDEFGKELNKLYKRLLIFPMISIAALTGHTFAGGAVLACVFDFRFMRQDRGWFCFPEIDLKIQFPPFLNAIANKVIPFYKLIEMQLTGKRLTADECQEHHIIDKACAVDNLVAEAINFGKSHDKDRDTLGKMKALLYRNIIALCED